MLYRGKWNLRNADESVYAITFRACNVDNIAKRPCVNPNITGDFNLDFFESHYDAVVPVVLFWKEYYIAQRRFCQFSKHILRNWP